MRDIILKSRMHFHRKIFFKEKYRIRLHLVYPQSIVHLSQQYPKAIKHAINNMSNVDQVKVFPWTVKDRVPLWLKKQTAISFVKHLCHTRKKECKNTLMTVSVNPCLWEQEAKCNKELQLMACMMSLAAKVMNVREKFRCLKKFTPSFLMRKTSVQIILMEAILTVDSVGNHSLSGRCCRFMYVPGGLTNRITVDIAINHLIIRTSCACML